MKEYIVNASVKINTENTEEAEYIIKAANPDDACYRFRDIINRLYRDANYRIFRVCDESYAV